MFLGAAGEQRKIQTNQKTSKINSYNLHYGS